MSKHFFRSLLLFTGLIIMGIIGVILVNGLDKDAQTAEMEENQAQVGE